MPINIPNLLTIVRILLTPLFVIVLLRDLFGPALLKYGPSHMATVLFEMESWFAEREYKSIEQGKGSLSQESAADPEGFERTNYMRSLVTYSSRY